MINPPVEIWELPTRIIGRQVMVFDSLPSTNDYAKILASSLADGTVILAREQSAGRGQYGRTWNSPAGAGVWLSVILRPPPDLMRPVVLTAWAGVSVAEAIRPLVNRQPALKWPNDVLLRGRKVCGILIEQGQATIVGIGLNVNQSATELLAAGLSEATSMAVVGHQDFVIEDVARAVVHQLDSEWNLLINGELVTLEACWKWRVGLLGRSVCIEQLDGLGRAGRLQEMAFSGLTVELPAGQQLHYAPESIRHLTENTSLQPEKTA